MTPPSPSPPLAPSTPVNLSDDEFLDDDLPPSVLEAYRASRLQEIQANTRRLTFGRVLPISKADYTREVTEASKTLHEGDEDEGGGVVCFLYKDSQVLITISATVPIVLIDPASILDSRILEAHINQLADLYPNTKFVSIVGSMCIPNYP